MGPVSHTTHSLHFSPTSWAPLQTAYNVGSAHFRYSTSRLSCLLSLQFGDGDTHYFERLIPGTVPLSLYDNRAWKIARLSSFLNKLSLIQGPCTEAQRPCMTPGFFDSTHHLSKASSIRSGASSSTTYHGVSGSRGVSSLLNFSQYKKTSAN